MCIKRNEGSEFLLHLTKLTKSTRKFSQSVSNFLWTQPGLVEREGLINSVHGLKQNSQTFLSLSRHGSHQTNSQLQIRQLFALKGILPRPCEQQNIPQLRFSSFSAPETAQTGRGQEISWEGAWNSPPHHPLRCNCITKAVEREMKRKHGDVELWVTVWKYWKILLRSVWYKNLVYSCEP